MNPAIRNRADSQHETSSVWHKRTAECNRAHSMSGSGPPDVYLYEQFLNDTTDPWGQRIGVSNSHSI